MAEMTYEDSILAAIEDRHTLAERVRMALAEAGYPDVEVREPDIAVTTFAMDGTPTVSEPVFHRALVVVGAPVPSCFDCWKEQCSDPDHGGWAEWRR